MAGDGHGVLRRLPPVAALALILAVGASGSRAQQGGEPEFHARAISVAEPFVLATEPGADSAAAYMVISSQGPEDDRLLGGTAEVAGSVEIEQTTIVDGVTKAAPLPEGIAIPAGGSVHLVPGAYRLVLQGLSHPLVEGERFAGTLRFAKAGTLALTYIVGPRVAPVGGAPFTLTDQDGRPFGSADLAGRPYAIFFGYTHCPDVCPTTLLEMATALRKLGADADHLRVVFVTIDPARDTATVLKDYLSAFDPRIVGLTGTDAAIAAAAKSFHVFYEKEPMKDGDYSMDHTASVFLVGADGRYAGGIAYGETMDTRLAKLRRLLAGG